MRSDHELAALFEEFPQLARKDIILEKELYAHFGLLFFIFALVEHSLVNFFVFDALGRNPERASVRCKAEWEAAFDEIYKRAKSLSLADLIGAIKDIPELSEEITEITRVKTNRDYFAHHFFRDEAAYFCGDARGWLLLVRLSQVRHHALELEERLKPKFDSMCDRHGLAVPSDDQLGRIISGYQDDAKAAALAGTATFGWEK